MLNWTPGLSMKKRRKVSPSVSVSLSARQTPEDHAVKSYRVYFLWIGQAVIGSAESSAVCVEPAGGGVFGVAGVEVGSARVTVRIPVVGAVPVTEMDPPKIRIVETPGGKAGDGIHTVEQNGKERGEFHPPEIDGLGVVVRKSAGDDRIAVVPVHGVAEEGVNPYAESFGIAVRIVQNFRIRGAEGGFRNRFPGAEEFHPPVIVVGALSCDKLDREDVVVLIRVETAAHPGLFLIRKAGDLPRFLPCGIQRRKKHRREDRNDRNYD